MNCTKYILPGAFVVGGGVVCSGAWDDTDTIAAFVKVHPSGTLSKLSCLNTSFCDPKDNC